MNSVHELQALGTASGQIPGEYNGEPICIHKFEDDRYKISTRTGTQCLNPRWVNKEGVKYDFNAFGNWLVEIKKGGMIKLDMRYAGNTIFPREDGSFRITKPLYGQGRCFMHYEARKKLYSAELILRTRYPKYRLMLLDCYRPKYVSQIMWDLIRDPKWVAASGKSSHNRGGAIDLTLATMDGTRPVEVDMGSPFDLFSKKSEYSYTGLTALQKKHRRMLRDVMKEAGFRPYNAEWWHFSISGSHHEHLDLPL